MKKIVGIAAVCLLVASGACAREWRPFVGVGGVAETRFSRWNSSSFFDANDSYPPEFARGLNFEFGVEGEYWEFYGGYSSTNSLLKQTYDAVYAGVEVVDSVHVVRGATQYTEESWGERRVRFGVRRRLLNAQVRVRPIVGAAFEIGEYKQQWHRERTEEIWRWTESPYDLEIDSETFESGRLSRTTLAGGAIEGGFAWQIAERIELINLLSARIYADDANLVGRKTGMVFSLSNQLQVRYKL